MRKRRRLSDYVQKDKIQKYYRSKYKSDWIIPLAYIDTYDNNIIRVSALESELLKEIYTKWD